jgi:hypothetical protein
LDADNVIAQLPFFVQIVRFSSIAQDCQRDDPTQPNLLSIMLEKQASAPAADKEEPLPKQAKKDENPFLSTPDADQSSLLQFGVHTRREQPSLKPRQPLPKMAQTTLSHSFQVRFEHAAI